MPILLQTARAKVRNAEQRNHGPTVEVRAILDTGSQRSYVTTRVQRALRAGKITLRSDGDQGIQFRTGGEESL